MQKVPFDDLCAIENKREPSSKLTHDPNRVNILAFAVKHASSLTHLLADFAAGFASSRASAKT